MSSDSAELVVSYAATNKHTKLTEYRLTWPELLSWLERAPKQAGESVEKAKDAAPLIKLATFRDHTRALAADPETLLHYGLEGDYDGNDGACVSLTEALRRLERWRIRAAVIPSHRHTAALPHWRVYAPLAGPMPQKEAAQYVRRLSAALGGILEKESANKRRMFYIGSWTEAPEPYEVLSTFGDPLEGYCIDELEPQTLAELDALATIQEVQLGTDKAERVTPDERRNKAEQRIDEIRAGESVHDNVRELVARYIALGMSTGEVGFWFQLLRPVIEAAPRSDSTRRAQELYTSGELERMIDGAAAKFDRDGAPKRSAPEAPALVKLPPVRPVALTKQQARTAAAVHAAVIDLLGTLAAEAREFLEGRSIDAGAAEAYGWRYCAADRWQWLGEELERGFERETLALSGWWTGDEGAESYSPPFLGRAPALLAPYYSADGELETLRAVELGPHARTRSLGPRPPRAPFGADALAQLEGGRGTLHLTEGELNAWTLRQRGAIALGLPGAGTPWPQGWPRLFAPARRLVLWFVSDKAGEKGLQTAVDTLAEALGARWLERVRRERLPDGLDVNALELEGRLGAYFKRGWND